MATSAASTLADERPQPADQLLVQVRAEIQQGFDQLTAKLVEEIQGLRSSFASSPLTVSSKLPPAWGSTQAQQSTREAEFPELSSQQEKLHSLASKSGHDHATPAEFLSEQVQLQSAANESSVDSTGKDQIALAEPFSPQNGMFSERSILHSPSHWRRAMTSIVQSHALARSFSTMISDIQHAKAKQESDNQRFAYRLVHSTLFTNLSLFGILSNAIWMGYESDHRQASQSSWQKWVGKGFSLWFIFELALKIVCLRQGFIFGPEYRWNFVDAVCVLSSIPDFFSTSVNLSFLRMVRLAKLTRGLRLVRLLQFLRSLREILMTVFFTMGSLFWSFVAIVFVTYIFSLLFLQLLGMHLDDDKQLSISTMDNFQDVLSTMKVLYSFITGGQDWYPFAQDFQRNGAYFSEAVLLGYIFFMLFGLINVVIAVFCAQAEEAGRARSDLRIEKDKYQEGKSIKEWIEIFNMIDTKSEGFVDQAQLLAFAHTCNGEHLLNSHGLNLFALDDLWNVMEGYTGKVGRVDMTGFVMGFMRLSDAFQSSNLMLLSRKIELLHLDSREMIRELHTDTIIIRQLHEYFSQHWGIQKSTSSMGEHQGKKESPSSVGEHPTQERGTSRGRYCL